MDGSDPDTKLMLRLQNEDISGFEELVSRHKDTVLNLAFRFMGDRIEAEDAVQEVFMRVFKARRRYEPTARFSTWLHRIATNYCLNAVKARRADRWWSFHGVGEDGEDYFQDLTTRREPGPEESLEKKEIASAIRKAIDMLPRSQRMAILLNKYHGQSYQEIADNMELTVMAVKSLLMRARVSLRDRLSRFLKSDDGDLDNNSANIVNPSGMKSAE